MKSNKHASTRFPDSLKIVTLEFCLGGTESLSEHLAAKTLSDAEMHKWKEVRIAENLVRLLIGVEAAEDSIWASDQALVRI